MELECKTQCLYIHNLWIIEENCKSKPDIERVQALKKVLAALVAQEPSEEQRQILQRLAVGFH